MVDDDGREVVAAMFVFISGKVVALTMREAYLNKRMGKEERSFTTSTHGTRD